MSESDEVFSVWGNPFKNLVMEYKRFKYFENSKSFIKPEPFFIGSTLEVIRRNKKFLLV